MKILFVNNARLVSGAEEHLLDLAARLPQLGIEPVFLVRRGGDFEQRLQACGIRCHPVFVPAKATVPFRIARAICSEQPDVISVNREHNIYPVLLAAGLARPLLRRRPKLVCVFHTPTSRHYPLLATLYDGAIATSEYTGASFTGRNPGLDRITTIIHYGIDLPGLSPDKADVNRPRRILKGRQFPVIAMVGELWKNQEELLDATVQLRQAFPEITVAIVGGGGTDHLQERIARHGLERNVILTGRIPRSQIPDLFYDCDLSVSTHRNEGFGIVHIESLAARTPVVAYNSGGLVEILRKGGGILVDGGVPEFAARVTALLADDRQRQALGEEGRRVVAEHFTLDIMAARHAAYYQQLVAGKVSR